MYPLKLTQQQRDSLIHCTRITNKIKERLKEAGEGTQVVSINKKELDHLDYELPSAVNYAPGPHKKLLMAVVRKVAELIATDRPELAGERTPKTRKTAPKKGDVIYQFKITLIDSRPPIWRRIQVEDCTLDKLHEHIQTAMGWTNSHLHQFEMDGVIHGDPELLYEGWVDEEPPVNSRRLKISKVMPKNGERFTFKYEYDFGDGWEHQLLFEGCPQREPGKMYPLCLDGERACPPEDVGGMSGYQDFLESIRDKTHEERAAMYEWVSGWFDPEEFDPEVATKNMKKGLPDWREME